MKRRSTPSAAAIAPLWATSGAATTATAFGLWPMFLAFLKIGAVLFGSGYVLLAFLRAEFVERHHWLEERELLDAVAVGQVTPGPVFTTATFIGYVLGHRHGPNGVAGAAVATLATEAIGVAAALFPDAWLTLFGDEPAMLAAGAQYLRIVGPFYGFFGGGMALYFASQGAGRLLWPLSGGFFRLLVAAGGGWMALRLTGSLTWLFAALALGLVIYGVTVFAAVMSGAWFSYVAPVSGARES